MKKNVYFWALAVLVIPPTPHPPNRATWSSFLQCLKVNILFHRRCSLILITFLIFLIFSLLLFFWVWLWCSKREKDIIILAILSGSKINSKEVIWIITIFPRKGENAHISRVKNQKHGFRNLCFLTSSLLTVSNNQVKRWSCLNINVIPREDLCKVI